MNSFIPLTFAAFFIAACLAFTFDMLTDLRFTFAQAVAIYWRANVAPLQWTATPGPWHLSPQAVIVRY